MAGRIRRLMSDMEFADRNLELAIARYAAAAERGAPADAAVALGAERGAAGVGIGPSLDDLETVHRLVLQEVPQAPVVRAFADAWAEAAIGELLGRGALDARTGLATIEFLATRLRDLARAGTSAERMLVVVECRERVNRFAALLRAARIANELLASFPGAETPIGVSATRIVALVPEPAASDANLARARIAIGRVEGIGRGDVGTAPLPRDEGAVGAFVRGL